MRVLKPVNKPEPASESTAWRNEQVFSTTQIAALLEVSLNEVDYWVRCKLLAPSVREASGHGSRRLYGWDDFRKALLVRRLRRANWKPKLIAKALTAVMSAMQNPDSLHTPVLIHEGSALLILCRSGGKDLTLLDAASPGQYVMVIALDMLEEETRRSLMGSK